jgi:hypothetical protein
MKLLLPFAYNTKHVIINFGIYNKNSNVRPLIKRKIAIAKKQHSIITQKADRVVTQKPLKWQ